MMHIIQAYLFKFNKCTILWNGSISVLVLTATRSGAHTQENRIQYESDSKAKTDLNFINTLFFFIWTSVKVKFRSEIFLKPDSDPTKMPGSRSNQNNRIQIQPNYSNRDPTKIPVSRSNQNTRIQIQPKYPDPDPTKIPGSRSNQNTRIQIQQNTRIQIQTKMSRSRSNRNPDPNPTKISRSN